MVSIAGVSPGPFPREERHAGKIEKQRVGRVHRLGQRRPVRVVHFIAQGTIEEGMLGLLAFKKSMFTGVLDDGKDEVFLGGTRLKKFVESVEKATGEIPPSMPRQTEPEPNGRIAEPSSTPQAPGSEPEQGWNDVLAAGVSLLEKLGKTLAANQKGSAGKLSAGLVARDENTGQSYLKLPLPDADTMRKITDLLGAFTGRDV